VVRRGLDGATNALSRLAVPEHNSLRLALATATQATAAIDETRPAAEQFDQISAAFADVAKAVLAAPSTDLAALPTASIAR
jgi:hypothetical protein